MIQRSMLQFPIAGFALLFVCFAGAAHAATVSGRLSGHVVDETGRPMEGVRIVVTGRGAVGVIEMKTDRAGLYQFPALPLLESLDVRAEAPGRVPLTFSGIRARPNLGARLDFRLRPLGTHEVLALVDARVPYHAVALEGVRSILGHQVVALEIEDDGLREAEALREAARRRPNALVAIGTMAAKLARRTVKDLPVVFTMVHDAEAGSLSAFNLCGLDLNGGFDDQLDALATIQPGAEKVVTIYDPRRLAGAVGALSRAVRRREMSLTVKPARNTRQIIAALESLEDEPHDAFFFLLDPELFDAGGFERVRQFAAARKMALVVPDPSMVAVGGTFSYGPGFREMGAYAGRLVSHLFSGADEPDDITVRYPSARYLSLNPHEIQKLGLRIPPEWVALAGGEGAARSSGAPR
ncbi:MAG TPA: ABC transporter substrate binding protein [Candidatus Polarisedimenticolia bacterium]|nr:ABC transporter substrate binding protein [Candidatus Polarisedimenticolia bacterium]